MGDLGWGGSGRRIGRGDGLPRRPGYPAGNGGRKRRRPLLAWPLPEGPGRTLAGSRANRRPALRLGNLLDRGARLRKRGPCDPRLEPVTHHPYPRPYLIYWETFARYISFLTTALTLSKIREMMDDGQRVKEELDRALEENRELKRLLQGDVGCGGIQEGHPPGTDPP